MKFKFSWLTGIILFFVIFILTVILRIVISRSYKFEMVTDDYYAKELKYQQQINKKNNTKLLSEQPRVTVADSVTLQMPTDFKNHKLTGTVRFYRPSDQRLDLKYPLLIDSLNRQYFQRKFFTTGKYILKLEWNDSLQDYYTECDFYIQ